MWPLSVASAESGRYFWTDCSVNPGRIEKNLFLISFSSVFLGGLNAAWWRYLMSAYFDVMAYAFYAVCLVWSVSIFVDVVLHSCSGNIHNLVCSYRPPFHTSFLL